jgi:hypothetical protein
MAASLAGWVEQRTGRVRARSRGLSGTAQPYTSPYAAGIGVGIVLLVTFVVTGRGLGASGAFSSVVTAAATALAPHHVEANRSFAPYAGGPGQSALNDWLVFEVLGIAIGGLASAVAGRRLRLRIERGPRAGRGVRLATAFTGGVTMGLGAKLARGCTSGLGLTGGAVLSVGAWLFIVCAFAAGYAVAPLLRRWWT